ncbi:MAG: hypothetical protein HKO65_13590 [Gemmatimonadetes bacterium]|nr:glycogen-binding domain-containing protein [Gemmatimonadota bacterium]NNM06116.1 hypothetical protein [Gemmatimonadota bacterium]
MRTILPKPGTWYLVLMVAMSPVLGSPAGLWAQTTDLSIELGGSTVSPPIGIEGEDAHFFVAGIRGLRFSPGGSGVTASFLLGRSLQEGAGGDFLSGTVGGQALKQFGNGWAGGVEARGFGFRVADPFPYRSLGAEGGPVLRFTRQNLSASVKGIAGGGWSETELQRTGREPSQLVKDELWRYGGVGEVLAGGRGILAGIAVGVHESSGGRYQSAGLRLLVARGGSALELRVDSWDTPSGTETTGGLAFILPLGGWDVRGFLGRTEPDPLTLAEPGGGSGGLLVGRRLISTGLLSSEKPPLHQVLESSDGVATVEIQVTAPVGTERVEVLGDFTLWEPIPLEADGTRWIVRLEIPFGVHHFGFLADGNWYLPDNAPDAVPDEWGRKNATIVIEAGRDPVPQSGSTEGTEGAVGL